MQPSAPRSNALLQMLCYLLAVFTLGALLAPLLYHGGKSLAAHLIHSGSAPSSPLGWLAGKLSDADFGRYFNRSFLICALGLLYPFLRWMRVTKHSLQLQPNPHALRHILTGFTLAAGLLLLMGAIFFLLGAYGWNKKLQLPTALLRAITTSTVVSLLEEYLFRGIFLGLALRASSRWPAIIGVSLFFAILHLVKPPEPLPPQLLSTPTWTSGFTMLSCIIRDYGDPARFLSEVSTLLLVGLILAWARVRTHSLWLPIGLHAGWVFGVILFSAITRTSRALKNGHFNHDLGTTHIPLIGENLKLGLAPLLTLALTWALLALYLKKRPTP